VVLTTTPHYNIIHSELENQPLSKKIFGLYNIGNKRIFTKYSFGLYIAKKNNLKKSFIYRFKSKVSIHKRPLNTIMSNKKIEKKLCIKIN
jgi:dTDP-4-dehydrorhamnose reductase